MLKDRVALVTGAGSGIGRSTAIRLASEGAEVSVVDIDSDAAMTTVKKIKKLGRRAYHIRADIGRLDQIRDLTRKVLDKSGHVDILVNNAGVTQIVPFLELQEDGWDRVMSVNLRGLFFCLQEVAKNMVQQKRGKIVNIASVSAFLATPLAAHYAASKAGVVSLTKSAAIAFAPYNIQVNAVCPGPTDTAMWDQIDRERGGQFGLPKGESIRRARENIPLKRFATPEDIAGAVAFLSSKDSDFITGQTIIVDGGIEAT